MTSCKSRELISLFPGLATSDGDGVNMVRLIGTPQLEQIDPFLLLDAFGSDNPDDYIGGFPAHPHRGFETVTYLLAGRMRHKDNAGNEGVIEPGGIQWMTAGRGIVHSEMPEQLNGLLAGFQLWVNLPASAKMTEPVYQEFSASQIPEEVTQDGATIRVISGTTDQGTVGVVNNHHVDPVYFDIALPADSAFRLALPEGHNAFIYTIEGEIRVGDDKRRIRAKELGILDRGDCVEITAGEKESRFLLVAGKPLNEPVARGGPFVMNTEEEIHQAFDDYRNHRF